MLVDFWDEAAFEQALLEALFHRIWDSDELTGHARRLGWDSPVSTLVSRFTQLSEQAKVNKGSVKNKRTIL